MYYLVRIHIKGSGHTYGVVVLIVFLRADEFLAWYSSTVVYTRVNRERMVPSFRVLLLSGGLVLDVCILLYVRTTSVLSLRY